MKDDFFWKSMSSLTSFFVVICIIFTSYCFILQFVNNNIYRISKNEIAEAFGKDRQYLVVLSVWCSAQNFLCLYNYKLMLSAIMLQIHFLKYRSGI